MQLSLLKNECNKVTIKNFLRSFDSVRFLLCVSILSASQTAGRDLWVGGHPADRVNPNPGGGGSANSYKMVAVQKGRFVTVCVWRHANLGHGRVEATMQIMQLASPRHWMQEPLGGDRVKVTLDDHHRQVISQQNQGNLAGLGLGVGYSFRFRLHLIRSTVLS